MLFSWKFDTYIPPRNANNVEPYTFVTLFSRKFDARLIHILQFSMQVIRILRLEKNIHWKKHRVSSQHVGVARLPLATENR